MSGRSNHRKENVTLGVVYSCLILKLITVILWLNKNDKHIIKGE